MLVPTRPRSDDALFEGLRFGGRLTVDLRAVAANYRALAARVAPAACAAVVKADAYGLGADRVAPALASAGCRSFFVAHLQEGVGLRAILGPGPRIAVLHGPPPNTQAAFTGAELVPVLNDDAQRASWQAHARRLGRRLPAMLQVDTGMARFGFPPADLAGARDGFEGIDPSLILSHLACADEPDNPANEEQRRAFEEARRVFPGVPGSLAASSGIFLGPRFHADLVRPGAALYGIAPRPDLPNPMRPVVALHGQVMQVRTARAGTAVGYGLVGTASRDGLLATVGVGYADGFPRAAADWAEARFAGCRLPLVGRVSMDSIVLDASDVPPGLLGPGSLVELIGPDRNVDAVAGAAGTIGYEILTRLGRRFERVYTDA